MVFKKGYIPKNVKSLDEFTLNQILIDYANNTKIYLIGKKFKISPIRITNIINTHQERIDKLRVEIANSLDAQTKALITQKRHQILNSISENDINNAKLKDKTSSVVDLTNVKRLESGQSTENLAINVNGMSIEQLTEFIKTGKVNVNEGNKIEE